MTALGIFLLAEAVLIAAIAGAVKITPPSATVILKLFLLGAAGLTAYAGVALI